MKLYGKHIWMHVKSAMQYKTSFVLLVISGMAVPLTSIAAFFMLFDRFGNVKGFTLSEVLFCFSIIYFGFSVTEMVLRGFDRFSKQIVHGGFDRMLVRPRTALFQVLCSEFEFTRVGRVSIAVVFMVYAMRALDIQFTAAKVAVFMLALLGSLALYAGLLLLHATLCFFTVEGLEITNILLDGGKDLAAYPIVIYGKAFRVIFTFIIPFACANYYPMLFILGKAEANRFCVFAPVACMLFLLPCLLAWVVGVKKYKSTGS